MAARIKAARAYTGDVTACVAEPGGDEVRVQRDLSGDDCGTERELEQWVCQAEVYARVGGVMVPVHLGDRRQLAKREQHRR